MLGKEIKAKKTNRGQACLNDYGRNFVATGAECKLGLAVACSNTSNHKQKPAVTIKVL